MSCGGDLVRTQFEVQLIAPDLPPETTHAEICRALQQLDSVAADVCKRVETRIAQYTDRVVSLSERVSRVETAIDAIARQSVVPPWRDNGEQHDDSIQQAAPAQHGLGAEHDGDAQHAITSQHTAAAQHGLTAQHVSRGPSDTLTDHDEQVLPCHDEPPQPPTIAHQPQCQPQHGVSCATSTDFQPLFLNIPQCAIVPQQPAAAPRQHAIARLPNGARVSGMDAMDLFRFMLDASHDETPHPTAAAAMQPPWPAIVRRLQPPEHALNLIPQQWRQTVGAAADGGGSMAAASTMTAGSFATNVSSRTATSLRSHRRRFAMPSNLTAMTHNNNATSTDSMLRTFRTTGSVHAASPSANPQRSEQRSEDSERDLAAAVGDGASHQGAQEQRDEGRGSVTVVEQIWQPAVVTDADAVDSNAR